MDYCLFKIFWVKRHSKITFKSGLTYRLLYWFQVFLDLQANLPKSRPCYLPKWLCWAVFIVLGMYNFGANQAKQVMRLSNLKWSLRTGRDDYLCGTHSIQRFRNREAWQALGPTISLQLIRYIYKALLFNLL